MIKWEETTGCVSRAESHRLSRLSKLPATGILNGSFNGDASKGDDLGAKVTALFEKRIVG